MQNILQGLTSVPGVMGGMLSDERGNVLEHSFPPFFDQGMISGVAEMLHDGAVGLQEATGGVKLFDVRFELGRILIKSLPKMFLIRHLPSGKKLVLMQMATIITTTFSFAKTGTRPSFFVDNA